MGSGKYSDSFWDDLEAEITTWDWIKRLGKRRILKREIEKFAPEGKRNERVKLYIELQGYTDVEGQRIDLHSEWIYRRILSHLRVSPFVKEEIHEPRRSLLRETSEYYRRKSRGKGARTPFPEGAAGIVVYGPEHPTRGTGRPIREIPGYVTGRPIETDKLEDELLADLFNFLTKRGLQVTTVNRLLVSISQSFLGKVIRGRAIQKRIRRHLN